MKPILRLVLIALISIVFASPSEAQDGNDYTVQANIIYRFTKYVNWPEEKKSGDFVIGVIGESPLFDELKAFVNNKTAGSQKIVVKKFASSSASFPCHILFIGEEGSSNIKKIVTATTGASTLLVTEADGLAKKGSCINFVLVQDHLKLEINKGNIEQRKLDIASELLSLGKVVK